MERRKSFYDNALRRYLSEATVIRVRGEYVGAWHGDRSGMVQRCGLSVVPVVRRVGGSRVGLNGL